MPDAPDYKVYRSRRRLIGGRRDGSALDALRAETRGDGNGGGPDGPVRVHGRRRRPITSPARFVAGFLLGIFIWLVASAALFLVSSLTATGPGDAAVNALDNGSSGLSSPTTTLVLGSDVRPKGQGEPGSENASQRADSIMLLRSGGGKSARLSIPRDTLVDIPGHGRTKINASYAFGGAALTIRTVKQLMGIDINHVIEINFANFPKLIDAMGGIDYTGGCVISKINGGAANGGQTLRLHGGTSHLDGKQALALARTRKNLCNHREDDRARAHRQQKILSAMRSRVLSPAGFARAPWIAWQTPRAIRTDMSGGTLISFLAGMATSGSAQTRILPGTPTSDGSLQASRADVRAAAQRFEAG